jgi:hypothetical protein
MNLLHFTSNVLNTFQLYIGHKSMGIWLSVSFLFNPLWTEDMVPDM